MIVVTGAFGFIGVYLVDALREAGVEVLATARRDEAAGYFARRGVRFQQLDITSEADFEKLPRSGVEGVVHLAGLLPANVRECRPHDYVSVNVLGTLNVLDYCRAAGVPRLIATTSYADVQNSWRTSPPVPSDEPRDFKLTGDHAVYVITKNAATDAILHASTEQGLLGSVFRLPPVYGYGPHLAIYVDGKLYKTGFERFVEKARAGEPIEVWGDPAAVRDIVYVKDVVQAFAKALASDRARGVYNISSGRGITLGEQARAIVDVFSPPDGPRSEIVFRPEQPSGITPYVFDISKPARDFGYSPEYDFRAMMRDYREEELVGRYDDFIACRQKPADTVK